MTTDAPDRRVEIAAINASAAFNRWAAFEVLFAAGGRAELKLPWRAELGQYAGFLHASLVGGLIDTACGFAAVTVAGRVLASHVSFNRLAPAVGDAFIARAHVVKAGKRQVFASAELFAIDAAGDERLVATGEAIFVPVGGEPAVPSPPSTPHGRSRADHAPVR